MSSRWNHETHVVDTVRPIKVFVPGSPAEETEHPAGFKVRVRGAGGLVTHAYRCPTHGLFDARVERASVPDEVACGAVVSFEEAMLRADAEAKYREHGRYCGLTSPWAGSFCGQGKAAGECAT